MSLTTQAKALSVSVSADHEHERALDNYRLSDFCFIMLIKIKKTDLKKLEHDAHNDMLYFKVGQACICSLLR
jgi:hypothetical protein